MSRSLYIPPHKWWSLFATATPGADLDAAHAAAWATDGRPGFPIRINNTTGSIGLAAAAGEVDTVAICHSNLQAGVTVALSGAISGSVVMPAWGRNGVPYTPYTRVGSPNLAATALDLAIGTQVDDDIVIGEVLAGLALELPASLRIDGHEFGVKQYGELLDNPLSAVPPYSDRARSRTARGNQYYDQASLDLILEWFDAQDGYAYRVPSFLILDPDDPLDGRLGYLSEPTFQQITADPIYLVNLEFLELPRPKW